jgi:cell division protein FtsB
MAAAPDLAALVAELWALAEDGWECAGEERGRLDAAEAERDELRAEVARLTAERDRLHDGQQDAARQAWVANGEPRV